MPHYQPGISRSGDTTDQLFLFGIKLFRIHKMKDYAFFPVTFFFIHSWAGTSDIRIINKGYIPRLSYIPYDPLGFFMRHTP